MGILASERMPALWGGCLLLSLISMACQCQAVNLAKADAVGEALKALEAAIRGTPEFIKPHQRRAVPRKIPRLEDIADTEYLDFPEEPPILQICTEVRAKDIWGLRFRTTFLVP